ncbi:hypothetical protein AB0G79_33100 [Streptomyces sp. NPDC020807]|uniref:hypothetical protein n=1 Tax=Streptomyces sp. NPDC020807 TaxID=3155119 RepID=UPI003411374E
MIKHPTLRALAVALPIGGLLFGVQHLWGETPARWLAVALLAGALADLWFHRTSRSGYWIERGTDSEVGEPCWVVKGGPFVDEDDDETVVGELGTYRQARQYIARNERLWAEAIDRQGARG